MLSVRLPMDPFFVPTTLCTVKAEPETTGKDYLLCFSEATAG